MSHCLDTLSATARIDYLCSARPPTLMRNPASFIAHMCTPWTEEEKKGLARTMEFRTSGEYYEC